MSYRYFSSEEVAGLSPAFAFNLDEARHRAGVPFRITSGYRRPDSGIGVANSSHHRGLAADIAVESSRHRMLIVRALLSVGFHRIGVYDKHVHVDCDPTLPEQVLWVGTSV